MITNLLVTQELWSLSHPFKFHFHLQKNASSGVMEVVPIDPELIQQISSVKLFIPNDLRSSDNRKAVFKSIQVRPRFMLVLQNDAIRVCLMS